MPDIPGISGLDIGQFLLDIIKQIASSLLPDAASALNGVVQMLNDLPYADLTTDWFRSSYAKVFALALAAAVLIGIPSAFIAAAKEERVIKVQREWFYWLEVYAVGSIIPFGYFCLMFVSYSLTQWIMSWNDGPASLLDILGSLISLESWSYFFASWAGFGITWILRFEVLLLQMIGLGAVVALLISYVLKKLGRKGFKLWDISVSLALMSLFTRPLMMFILTWGSKLIANMQDDADNRWRAPVAALGTLAFAAVAPFLVLWVDQKVIAYVQNIRGGKVQTTGGGAGAGAGAGVARPPQGVSHVGQTVVATSAAVGADYLLDKKIIGDAMRGAAGTGAGTSSSNGTAGRALTAGLGQGARAAAAAPGVGAPVAIGLAGATVLSAAVQRGSGTRRQPLPPPDQGPPAPPTQPPGTPRPSGPPASPPSSPPPPADPANGTEQGGRLPPESE